MIEKISGERKYFVANGSNQKEKQHQKKPQQPFSCTKKLSTEVIQLRTHTSPENSLWFETNF